MHVRFSTTVGTPVTEEHGSEIVASVSGILIHPDMGKIEGFYVAVPGFFRSEELFLSTMDIIAWGTKIRIRSKDVFAPLDDLYRLRQILEEGRTVLGQRIITEAGVNLGTCRDVQFDTHTFVLEWLFPKKFLRWMRPIPSSAISIIRADAIVIKDTFMLPEVTTGPSVLETLDPLGTSTVSTRAAQMRSKKL